MVSRWALPLAVAVALLSGAGCGSGGGDSTTGQASGGGDTATTGSAPQAQGKQSTPPAGKHRAAAKETQPTASHGGKKNGKGNGRQGKASTGGRDHQSNQDAEAPRGQGLCPSGVSKQRCKAMIRAAESSPSKPLPKNRCPSSLSRQECEAVIQAEEEAEKGSKPVQPGEECPPTIPREECERLAHEAGY